VRGFQHYDRRITVLPLRGGWQAAVVRASGLRDPYFAEQPVRQNVLEAVHDAVVLRRTLALPLSQAELKWISGCDAAVFNASFERTAAGKPSNGDAA
jgi:hypothetical protein